MLRRQGPFMVDIVDTSVRSRMMAGIKRANTRPELELRRALHAAGYRYRLHSAKLAGKPDIVLPRYRAVIFVHGCFWHRHDGCRYATTPATRTAFWKKKFAANVRRDARNQSDLQARSWRVAIVWECSIKHIGCSDITRRLTEWLAGEIDRTEI
jgi:DNA mismatch endonuclease, patch repair protein